MDHGTVVRSDTAMNGQASTEDTMTPRPTRPAWLRELETGVVTSPQILLYGNVRDRYLLTGVDGSPRFYTLREALWQTLQGVGYEMLLCADGVDGVQVVKESEQNAESAKKLLGSSYGPGARSLSALTGAMRAVVHPVEPRRLALAFEYAARLTRELPHLDGTEHEFFTASEKLAHQAVPLPWDDGVPRYNPVIWIVDHERELPGWFLSGENVRRISVPLPELDDRHRAATALAAALPADEPGDRTALALRFAEQTSGMSLRSMLEIVRLGRAGVGPVTSLEDAVRCYRVGILDNPWSKDSLRRRMADARPALTQRVRGQEEAVQRCIDIVVRSVMGLSGAQSAGSSAKPRGVMFFAGPTGVGKTELAKALTALIFGDQRAYIRFDMSEFAAEHASERLVGAPPGYIGHDAGGELTNAVRERPFSLLLFDEIEKAHGRVLDRFLQILDDGRLTDGSGSTVYFSESVIVFTSNLGVRDDDPTLPPGASPLAQLGRRELESRIRGAVQRHFVEVLGRPELLNRLGDNIVVFNFIGREAADEIFNGQLTTILDQVARTTGVCVCLAPHVRQQIRSIATADLSFGGRGIGMVLESVLVNPLARALFALPESAHREQTVHELDDADGMWTLQLRSTTNDDRQAAKEADV